MNQQHAAQTGPPQRILAISGSLRAKSTNFRLLHLAQRLAPAGMHFTFYQSFDALPAFNPDIDLEDSPVPPPVAAWRGALDDADGVVISCPEYAHGVPGAFKNALDWTVSSASFYTKPVVLLNASPAGAEIAQASLVETLRLLTAIVLEGQSLLRPFLPTTHWNDSPGEPAETAIRAALAALSEAITANQLESAAIQ